MSNNLLTTFAINTSKTEEFHVMIRNKYRYGFLPPDSYGYGKQEYLYIEIGLGERIVDVMKGLTIYEFPSLILVHKSLLPKFTNKYKTCLVGK